MVTLVILSVGIVAIFQSLIISLDRVSHLTNRLYATNLLDNRISTIQRMLKVYKALPFDAQRNNDINVGAKALSFKEEMKINEIDDLVELFKLELAVKWSEGNQTKRMSRTVYISEF
jgi:hypothetical protein